MKKDNSRLKTIAVVAAAVMLVAVIAAIGLYVYRSMSGSYISVGSDNRISVTPEKIVEVKSIGQWEFMSMVNEQVIDTIRHNRLLSDDRLTCIYYGTVRLGIDLNGAPDDWAVCHGDTVDVTLPQPKILDNMFIDEARTRVFYESGRWDSYARERMYRQARRLMAAEANTPENLQYVRSQAAKRFDSIFRSIGAKVVNVEFEPVDPYAFNAY